MPASLFPLFGCRSKRKHHQYGRHYHRTGFISLSGTVAQNLEGNFGRIKIDNAAGVSLTAATTIVDVLNIASGTLTTNNNLTLASTSASQCACLDDMSSGGMLSGDVTVERQLPAGNNRWFYMGTSVQGQTFGNLLADNSSFKPYNIYTYSPNTAANDGWTSATASTALAPGQAGIAFGNTAKLDYIGQVVAGDGAGNAVRQFRLWCSLR